MVCPFDAVLLIAFGGPQGPDDIRPFLANVLRGRRVAPGRLDEVAQHYERFGGVSPITELTRRQAEALQAQLAAAGTPLPVHVGMRNWHPYLADTLAAMSRAGARRAIGFIAAPHRSYSSCTQYRENVAEARATLARRGLPDVGVTYVPDWHLHPDFIAANADNVRRAVQRLPEGLRAAARLIFAAHSIPVSMAERYPYERQFQETARLVAEAVVNRGSRTADRDPRTANREPRAAKDEERPATREPRFATAFQSRSGRPEDPWLGPDICEYLRDARARGLNAAVISPVGFVADHVEVLYDLDVEAAGVCREIGLPMVRAAAVNDHPRFIEMMADVVLRVCRQYGRGRSLEVVPGLSSQLSG
ncbi:MAG TPA: ferrochelatase [Vicinamibacterales bacterium]|nr:ferrochelatase [Vicinamibacterales bacterium]